MVFSTSIIGSTILLNLADHFYSLLVSEFIGIRGLEMFIQKEEDNKCA